MNLEIKSGSLSDYFSSAKETAREIDLKKGVTRKNTVWVDAHNLVLYLAKKIRERTMKYKLVIIALITTLLSITGCSTTRTYTGEQKPLESISILKGAWNEYFITTVRGHIESVDGKDVSGSDKVEVLPGQHEISVFLSNRNISGVTFTSKRMNLSIITEPGHVYVVDGNWNSNNSQIWIQDETTGKIAAGDKPK